MLTAIAACAQSYNTPAMLKKHESMMVHMNTDVFLTGENLLFKLYCVESTSSTMSEISKMAYVELIGENHKPVAQIKITLEHGEGYGDFFFSDRVPSGKYTLIAYTKWMRNFNELFTHELTLINPLDVPALARNTKHTSKVLTQTNDATFEISVRPVKHLLNKREKLEFEITGDPSSSLNLSVNARLLEKGIGSKPSISKNASALPSADIRFLPELRGELITGTAVNKADKKPYAGELVTLSAPSKNYQFLISTTDSSGRYYFNASDIKSDNILLNAYKPVRDEIELQVDNCFLGDYGLFVPDKLQIDSGLVEVLKKRSLSVQVENAFYAVKKDSVLNTRDRSRFFIAANKIYRLDDFTRFPTMEDVFREIVPEVVVKMREGKFSVVMMNSASGYRFENAPLVLIDGIPIDDANIMMKYDPAMIENIAVVTQRYFYGGLETDGIISIETYNGNAKDLPISGFLATSYIEPSASRIYHNPKYDLHNNLKRIPDFRTQLYWEPIVHVEAGSTKKLNFFTNDLPGKYLIEVSGLTSSGRIVYSAEIIEVR
jgi:hypothetical protein